MSRARIGLATATVLAGLVGAGAVLKATESDDDARSGTTVANVPPPPAAHSAPAVAGRLVVVRSRSHCLVDRTARTVVFRVVVRNSGNQDHAGRLHPWVGFPDGGAISVKSHDRMVGVLAAEVREYAITVPYGLAARPAGPLPCLIDDRPVVNRDATGFVKPSRSDCTVCKPPQL